MPINSNSIPETKAALHAKLGAILTPLEIQYKAELIYEINKLKKERGAIILGHNYMEPALYYGVSDEIGDSLELAKKAAETSADPIIFCGVRFMAETAKILNPTRKVLLPAKIAGCSLAGSIKAEDVIKLKERFPNCPVVTYINTYADVKAETDVCVTSSTASKIVNALEVDKIIFIPDEFLTKNVAAETNRKVVFPEDIKDYSSLPEGKILIGWHGTCEVHEKFTVDDITRAREAFPSLVVLAHPECRPEVVSKADFSGSTSKMIQFIREKEGKGKITLSGDAVLKPQADPLTPSSYLLLTECSMGDNIAAEIPNANIAKLCSHRCPHMNEITLEDTLRALREDEQQIEVPEDIRIKAKRSLDEMLRLSAS